MLICWHLLVIKCIMQTFSCWGNFSTLFFVLFAIVTLHWDVTRAESLNYYKLMMKQFVIFPTLGTIESINNRRQNRQFDVIASSSLHIFCVLGFVNTCKKTIRILTLSCLFTWKIWFGTSLCCSNTNKKC